MERNVPAKSLKRACPMRATCRHERADAQSCFRISCPPNGAASAAAAHHRLSRRRLQAVVRPRRESAQCPLRQVTRERPLNVSETRRARVYSRPCQTSDVRGGMPCFHSQRPCPDMTSRLFGSSRSPSERAGRSCENCMMHGEPRLNDTTVSPNTAWSMWSQNPSPGL